MSICQKCNGKDTRNILKMMIDDYGVNSINTIRVICFMKKYNKYIDKKYENIVNDIYNIYKDNLKFLTNNQTKKFKIYNKYKKICEEIKD